MAQKQIFAAYMIKCLGTPVLHNGKKIVSKQMALGKLDIHMQNNEVGPSKLTQHRFNI